MKKKKKKNPQKMKANILGRAVNSSLVPNNVLAADINQRKHSFHVYNWRLSADQWGLCTFWQYSHIFLELSIYRSDSVLIKKKAAFAALIIRPSVLGVEVRGSDGLKPRSTSCYTARSKVCRRLLRLHKSAAFRHTPLTTGGFNRL